MKITFVLFSVFLCVAGNLKAQDSVFYYVKPDWWNEVFWPNGIRLRNGENIYSFVLLKERKGQHTIMNPHAGDKTVYFYAQIHNKLFPATFTFPETHYGRLGSLLLYGQSFFDFVKPQQIKNLRHKGSDDSAIITNSDLTTCASLPGYFGECNISWDVENNALFFAGYMFGISPFASDKTKFLALSIGIGFAYHDVNITLNLCSNLLAESGDHDEDRVCTDKTSVDDSDHNGFEFISNLGFIIYEYRGDTFGFGLGFHKRGTIETKTDFKSHENLDFNISGDHTEWVSLSIFF